MKTTTTIIIVLLLVMLTGCWMLFPDPIFDVPKTWEVPSVCANNTIYPMWNLVTGNPYDLPKGYCYRFVTDDYGEKYNKQLLDRSKALYFIYERGVQTNSVIVDFGEDSVPRRFDGIVISLGVIEYKSPLGGFRVAPAVHVIQNMQNQQ